MSQSRRMCRRISIHAPRTGSDGRTGVSCGYGNISIHAPRTGSDMQPIRRVLTFLNFNPRSPHGERRLTIKRTKKSFKFQSTLPARGATSLANLKKGKRFGFQSTLPARGATEILRDFTKAEDKISIHAPRTGSDEMCCCYSIRCRFQSTLPARGATFLVRKQL